MRRLPALDGLRGLAVCFVLLFHGDFIDGGFLGVDIFFTLSGFLITSLLLSEYETEGRIDFRKFYFRRILRLAPALLTLVLFCWAAGLVSDISIQVGPTLFYYANFYRFLYPPGILGPFEHTWSLSIEEQFYLLWPAAFYFLIRRFTRARAAIILFALICLANLWRLYLWRRGVELYRFYNGTDIRLDEMLWGCALALIRPSIEARAKHLARVTFWGLWGALALLCALSLSMSVWSIGNQIIVYALAPPATCLLIWIADRRTQTPILSGDWLRAVGGVSYGLYLWHFPILQICDRWHAAKWLKLTGYFALSAAAAVASYYLVEKPFLRLKDKYADGSELQRITNA